MASNELPKALESLFTAAEDAADGLASYGLTTGVKNQTEAVMRAAIAAATAESTSYNGKRGQRRGFTTAQTIADSNGKGFIASARSVLEKRYGTVWHEPWQPTGFINGSLAIPSTMAKRQALLKSLQTYFENNGTHESVDMEVTAALAEGFFDALSNTRSAVKQFQTDLTNAKKARDAAVRVLRRKMSALIEELDSLLDENDARWYSFGFNPPGAPGTPEMPESLLLTAGEPGTVLVDWADAPRAHHYRILKQVVGVDADFVQAGSRNDSDFTLTELTSGSTVKVKIIAVNDDGDESPASEIEEIVVP